MVSPLSRWLVYLLSPVALLALTSAAEAASLKVVAEQLADSPAPPAQYRKFAKRGPSVGANPGERVVFEGLARNGTTVKGMFAGDPDGGGSVLAEKHGPAPEAMTINTFQRRFPNPSIDSTGTIAIAAKLARGFGEAIYLRKAGDTSLSTTARTGDPAAGLSSGFLKRFNDVEPLGLAATTAVTFIADISDMPNIGGLDVSQVIYACSGGDLDCHAGTGTLNRIVALGDAVDDRPGQEICKISHLAGSEYGVAFRAKISPDCTSMAEVDGVFRKQFGVGAGTVETLALVDEAAALPGSTYIQFRDAIDIANDGTVAFRARTRSTLHAGVETALFICDPTSCPASPAEAAVSKYDTLPGGNEIRSMEIPRTVISDAGDLAFFAKSSGPQGSQKGIYIRRANGTIEAVAEKGDTVPMLSPMDPAAVFTSFSSAVAMSDDGRVAFLAKIRRASGPKRARRGIFVYE